MASTGESAPPSGVETPAETPITAASAPPSIKKVKVPPSVPETITAGKYLRVQKRSLPKRAARPPPKPAMPRGMVPTDRDVKMSRRDMIRQAQCLRRHNIVLSDRLDELSKPTRRQLIALWRNYADILTPEQIYNLQNMLESSEPFKPDQAYEYFMNLRKARRRQHDKEGKKSKRNLSALCGDRRFAWVRSATVAFARGIQRRLAKPSSFQLEDGMLRLSNIVLNEICCYSKMKPPSRTSKHPKAKFMYEMADKIAVWIDEILAESDERLLMMDFDEDDEVKYADEPYDDFLNMMAGKGRRLTKPKPAYLKFTELLLHQFTTQEGMMRRPGDMLEAFKALTDAMYKKGPENLVNHGKHSATYKEGADDLRQAEDLNGIDFDPAIADDIAAKMNAITKPAGKLEDAMKEIIDICSKYLAQQAEYNKDKGEAFKYLIGKMHGQPNELLCKKGRITELMEQGAVDLEKAKGLFTDHDDPVLTQLIHSALDKLAKGHPSELNDDEMKETLDMCAKYLSQKVADDSERGPAFEKMIEILKKHGGKTYMDDHPALKTSYEVAHALEHAPGLTSIKADPTTAPKFQENLHLLVDAETPGDMTDEMKEAIKTGGDYLSGFARDRGKAQEILVKMMQADPTKEAAQRKGKAMTYGEGAQEFAHTPILAAVLPVHDVAKEVHGKVGKDVEKLTPPELAGAMKTITRDAGGDLSQDVALISGVAGDRYGRNLLAAAETAKGDEQLFKTGAYGMTYAEAGESIRNAGKLEVSNDPRATALSKNIEKGLKVGVDEAVNPTTAHRLEPITAAAAEHLAKIGTEMNDALTFLLDTMQTKGEEPLANIQGMKHSYNDCVKKVARAPTLANDNVDRGVYENIRSKLKDLMKSHPEYDKLMPVVIDDVAKFLAKPVPSSEAEKMELVHDLLMLKKSQIFHQEGKYKMTYGDAADEVMKVPVGAAATAAAAKQQAAGIKVDPAKKKEMEAKLHGEVEGVDLSVQNQLDKPLDATAAHLAEVVVGRGEAMEQIHKELAKKGETPLAQYNDAGMTYGEGAKFVEDTKNFTKKPNPPGLQEDVAKKLAELPTHAQTASGEKHMKSTLGMAANVIAAETGRKGGYVPPDTGEYVPGKGAGAGGAGARGVGPGGVGAGGVGPGGVGVGGVGPGGVGAGGVGSGGAGAGGVGPGGVGPGGVGPGGVGPGGVGPGGVGPGGVGPGGVGPGGVGPGGVGPGGVGPGGVGPGGVGPGGVGPGGVGPGGVGPGGVGPGGVGPGGVGPGGVGPGGVGAGGVGPGGVGPGGVGPGGVGPGGVGAGGVGPGGVGPGGVGPGGVGPGGVGPGGVGPGGVGPGGVGPGGVGPGGVGPGGVGPGGVGAGAGAQGFGAGWERLEGAGGAGAGAGAGGFGPGGVGPGGVGPGGVGPGGVGPGGVGPGGVGPGGYGADGYGPGGLRPGGVGAAGAGARAGGAGAGAGGAGAGAWGAGAGGAGAGAGGMGADAHGPGSAEYERARRLSEIRRRIAAGERGGVQDKDHEDAKAILLQQLRNRGLETFYKQGQTDISNALAADVIERPPMKVDKNISDTPDTDKLTKKFERKLGYIAEDATPGNLRDAMTDVIIESARPLAEHAVAQSYKVAVEDALIDGMQRKDNELLVDEDGDTETFFYAAQRLKKNRDLYTRNPHPKTARDISKKLDDCTKCRPMARKLAGTMRDHMKQAADYLSDNATYPDPEIDALVDLLNEMEDAGDKQLIGGRLPKTNKQAAEYLKNLTSLTDRIGKADPKLQAEIEKAMQDLMRDVATHGYTPEIRNRVIEQQAKLLTAFLLQQAEKVDALNGLVEYLDAHPNEMILRHGTARKSGFDAAQLLHGKDPDDLLNVKNIDPVVARKLQIRLNNLMAHINKPFMSAVIDDVANYLAVHLLHPQTMKVCKCMKSVFVQCELWNEEILRRVTRPCCTCSQSRVADKPSFFSPGVEIQMKECPSMATHTRDGPCDPCPGTQPKPYQQCPAKHDAFMLQTDINFKPASSISLTRLRPQPETPGTQLAATFSRLGQQLWYSGSEMLRDDSPVQRQQQQLTSGNSSSNSSSYNSCLTIESSSSNSGQRYPQSPWTMFAQTQGRPTRLTSSPTRSPKQRGFHRLRSERNSDTSTKCNTTIVTTDQMSDLYAMVVSLMWNMQAWRGWLQNQLDTALNKEIDPNLDPDEAYSDWTTYQRRVVKEAAQWRQYIKFSQQLTLRLEQRYKDKQIVSPTRASNKTRAYLECQNEMFEITYMFNKWTQWLLAVLRETETIQPADPFDNTPLYVLRWTHYKEQVEASIQDWTRYKTHLNVCWENKYRMIMSAWEQEGPVWVMSACGAVPSGAVSAGTYNDEVIWVARTTHKTEVLPAALLPSKHCCIVYADGAIHSYTKYQVLCNADVEWVAWRAGGGGRAGVVTHAVCVAPGVHVGRVEYHTHYLVGAVLAPSYRCHVVIHSRPFAFECFDLLVTSPSSTTFQSV